MSNCTDCEMQVDEYAERIAVLEECCTSLLSIIDTSNCCDSPLYRDDIETIKARFNGSK